MAHQCLNCSKSSKCSKCLNQNANVSTTYDEPSMTSLTTSSNPINSRQEVLNDIQNELNHVRSLKSKIRQEKEKIMIKNTTDSDNIIEQIQFEAKSKLMADLHRQQSIYNKQKAEKKEVKRRKSQLRFRDRQLGIFFLCLFVFVFVFVCILLFVCDYASDPSCHYA